MLTGVLGGLTLGVGEVRRHGDDGLSNGLTQISLGVCLQLLQDHSGNFLGGVGLAVHVHLIVATHLSLDGDDGAVRVGDGLALCHLADHSLAVLRKGHDGGGGAVAFCVGDDDGFAALHDSHTGVSST